MELSSQDVAIGVGTALAVGALVGLERERRSRAEKQPMFGGIRTFPLIALLGSLSGLAVGAFGTLGMAVPFVCVCAFLIGAYIRVPRTPESPSLGLTSEFAGILVFFLGAVPFLEAIPLSFQERLVLSGSCGAVVMAALALREPLHKIAESVSGEDLFATVRFILLAVVLLPLLPDQTWDPYEALSPFKIGVFVVLVAAVSFVGYVAVRVLGERKGIGVTAVFGGIASSTAVTFAFSHKAKAQPELSRISAFAIVIACTIMLPRLFVILAIIHPPLVQHVWPIFAATTAVGVLGSAVLYRIAGRRGETVMIRREGEEPKTKLNNPFSMKAAFKLGLAFAAIRFVAAAAYELWSDTGLYVSALLAGLSDVDALLIAVTRMFANNKVSAGVACISIACAILTNSLIKTGFALFIGGKRVGALVACVLIPTAIVGIVTALLL
ncbi:hypothetical protein PLCT1_01255 [Planctomycetaceae bacterium]|nr:hypothetical protein PLCT1_01255 [Planctomycetaceae bacterium]